MQLSQLETFLAVAGKGGVTAAASERGLAPSSVSAQIRALEQSLGTALFARSTAGLALTDAGRRLLPWARRLLEQAELARREVAATDPPIRLGALETLAATHVPGILTRLRERRPDIGVAVLPTADRAALLAGLSTGDLDAGLLFDTGATLGSLGFPVPAGLEFCDLDPVPLAVVAAPGHPLTGRSAVTTAELGEHPMIVSLPGCSFRYAVDSLVRTAGRRTELASITVVAAWARHGLGVALLPEFAIDAELTSGALRHIELAAALPELVLRLVWRTGADEPRLRQVLYAATG